MQWAVEEQVEETSVVMEWVDGKDHKARFKALWAGPRVVVLPVYNLTAAPAPLKELEQLLSKALAQRGAVVLEKQILEEFMSKRRMRHTGGLDTETAMAMADETGAEAALVSTLEYFEEGDPPKISLHSRLVSTGLETEILWMDSVCRAGDDAPGLLDLKVMDTSQEILESAAYDLAGSLIGHLAGNTQTAINDGQAKEIMPTVSFRAPGFDLKEPRTVAVMPFFNLSERPYAWEILPLHFVKAMLDSDDFIVLEPGVVRQALLRTRVMVRGGLSKPHLELVLSSTEADLVVSGSVMRYLDSPYPAIDPEVEFSVQVYDQKNRKVVWSSRSVGRGDDGVYFFNQGFRSTACKLGSGLSRATVAKMKDEADQGTATKTQEGTIP